MGARVLMKTTKKFSTPRPTSLNDIPDIQDNCEIQIRHYQQTTSQIYSNLPTKNKFNVSVAFQSK